MPPREPLPLHPAVAARQRLAAAPEEAAPEEPSGASAVLLDALPDLLVVYPGLSVEAIWEMPYNILNPLLAAIPRLRAQRQLDLIEAVALGTGSVKKHESSRSLRQLQEQARGGRRQEPSRPDNEEEWKQALATYGFGYEPPPSQREEAAASHS